MDKSDLICRNMCINTN